MNAITSQARKAAQKDLVEASLARYGDLVNPIRATFPKTLAIYAFGSRINGTADVNSDLDLAILVAGYADPLQLWEVANLLTDPVGCSVDLLDMRASSTVMQYQILQTGCRLWGQEPDAGLFECFVLSEKTALNSARADLMADIQKQGRIYGR